ncbi:hypothetical protein GCM10009775_15770 [Microbacterium aoyamense]|uniref:Uncharacterized protein n=1 Tax=Microbacterium aoyamense TaxID=344166 RepID=A0ABN2PMD5_9MICO|nr:hypothetical protein [Microbacterium aoyamense]
MDYLFIIGMAVLIAIGFLAWAFVHWYRRYTDQRDDLQRAGDPGEALTPQQASRRAEGKAAWTRITGM